MSKKNHFGRKSLTDSLPMPCLIAALISAASLVLIVLIRLYLSWMFLVNTSDKTALLAVHPFGNELAKGRSGGPLSRPFDKSLGRKADPEGGKIYDKRSAWAGANTYTNHMFNEQLQAWIEPISHVSH